MTSPQIPKRRALIGAILAACLACILPNSSPADPSLNLTRSETSASLPKIQPTWKTPSDQNMVFYLQRSMNRNTVVYTTQYDPKGALKKVPIKAYWRRYAEQGQTRALKWIERKFAYGVKSRQNQNDKIWAVRFAALSNLPLELRHTGPNSAALWARINNRDYRLIYGYLDLDESGLITRVVQLRLVTFDPTLNKYVTHLISVSDGDIRE